jgi:hypothetical protein
MFVKKVNDSICIKTKKGIRKGCILFVKIVNHKYVCNGVDYDKNNKIDNVLYFDDTFHKHIVNIINQQFNTACLLRMFLKNISYYETGILRLIEDYFELENFECKLEYSKYDLENLFEINYKEIDLNNQVFYNLFNNVKSVKYLKANNRHTFKPIIIDNINKIVAKMNNFLEHNNTYIHKNETRMFGNTFNFKNNFYKDINIENINHKIFSIDIYKKRTITNSYKNVNFIKLTTFIYSNKEENLENCIGVEYHLTEKDIHYFSKIKVRELKSFLLQIYRRFEGTLKLDILEYNLKYYLETMFGIAKCSKHKCHYTATHAQYLGPQNHLPNRSRRINYNTCLCDVHFNSSEHTNLIILDEYNKNYLVTFGPFINRQKIFLQNSVICHYSNLISYFQEWNIQLNKIIKYIKRNKIIVFDKFIESDNSKYSKYVSWFYDNRYHIFELEHNPEYKETYFSIRDKNLYNVKFNSIKNSNEKKIKFKNITVESEHEDKKNILWNNFIKEYGL